MLARMEPVPTFPRRDLGSFKVSLRKREREREKETRHTENCIWPIPASRFSFSARYRTSLSYTHRPKNFCFVFLGGFSLLARCFSRGRPVQYLLPRNQLLNCRAINRPWPRIQPFSLSLSLSLPSESWATTFSLLSFRTNARRHTHRHSLPVDCVLPFTEKELGRWSRAGSSYFATRLITDWHHILSQLRLTWRGLWVRVHIHVFPAPNTSLMSFQ